MASDCCVVNSRGRRFPDAERQCTQAMLQAAVISHVTVIGAESPPCKKRCEPRSPCWDAWPVCCIAARADGWMAPIAPVMPAEPG